MEQYFRTRASVDDDPDLARNRRANDARLKSRFEHIFAKYGQDFDGVGDEIDLETGEIIVNNGHVERMRHEVDPGKRVSSQVLQVLGGTAQDNGADGRGSAVEDSLEDWEDDEGLSVSGDSSSDDGNDDGNDDDNSQMRRMHTHAPDELSSDFYPPDDNDPVTARREPARGERIHESHGRTPSRTDNRDNESTRERSHEISHNGSPANPLATLPFFQQSMEAMQTNPGQRGSIDPNAIQALGRSIADQLARFMTGDSKVSRKKSRTKGEVRESRWQYPVLPGDRVGRTPSLSPPGSPSAALFAASPDGEASIWAPQPPRRAKKGHAGADGELADNEPRTCYNCGRVDASTWRRGPGGVRCGSCSSYCHKYGLEKRIGDGSVSHRAESRPRSVTMPAHKEPYPRNDETDVYELPATSTPAALAGYSTNTARRLLEKGMPAKRQSTETEIGREVLFRGHIPMSTPTDDPDGVLNPAENVDDGHDSGDNGRRHGRARYTVRENQLIIGLRENDQMSWDEIANFLPERSAAALAVHYSSNLRNRVSLPRANSEFARRELVNPGNPTPEEFGRRMEEVPDNGEEYPQGNEDYVVQQDDGADEEQLGEGFAGPYTPEEDELIVIMKDKEDMTFAEMTEYLIGRTEDALFERYTLLTAYVPRPEHLASQTSARANPNNSISAGDVRSAPSRRSHHDDARNLMPPPPVPRHLHRGGSQSAARMATPMDKQHINGHTPRAGQHNTPVPQTPLVFIPNTGPPPGPSEVSLSAWATTQPASKGPLPFQPARKHLVPVQPNIPPFKLVDPFVSRSNSSVAHRQDHSTLSDPQRRRGRPKKAPANQSVDELPWKPMNILPQAPTSVSPSTELQPRRSSRRTRISSLADQEGIYTIPTPDDVDFLHSIADSNQGTQEADVATNPVNEVQTHVGSAGEHSSMGQRPGGTRTINAAFTAKQDKFIKKAREKQQMSWADIAENLPGDSTFTAQAVTSRYYDVIITSTPRSKTHVPTTGSETEIKLRQQYSAEESEKVAYYRDEEGMQWKPMSRVMPGRTAKSLQNHYFYHYYVPRQKKLLEEQGQGQDHVAAGGPRAETPLLRQALKNSTRRASEGADLSARPGSSSKKSSRASKRSGSDANTAGSPQNAKISAVQVTAPEVDLDESRSLHGGSTDEMMNVEDGDNELASRTTLQPVTQDKVTNAVDEQSEFASPLNIIAATGQHQHCPSPRHVAHVYIEPFRDIIAPPSLSELLQSPLNEPGAVLSAQPEGPGNRAGYEYRSPSPAYAAVYDTPARSHHHSASYFSAPNPNLATTRGPLDESYGQLDDDNPVSSPTNDTIVYETSIHEQDANSTIFPEAANSGLPVARGNSVDSLLSTGSKQAGPSGTKRKRLSGSSKRVIEFEVADSDSDSLEAKEPKEDRDDGTNPKRPRRTLAQPKRFSSECHDLTRRKGPKASERVTDTGNRNAPVRRGVKPGSKRGSYRKKRPATGSSSGPKHELANDDAAQGDEDPARPRCKGSWLFLPDPNEPMQSNSDWADAVSAALQSTPSHRMAGHAVLAWFRDKYEYYRNSEGPWYHRVRNVLRRSPIFKKVDPDAHNSEWTFADEEMQFPSTVLAQNGCDGGDEEGDTSIFDGGDHLFPEKPVQNSADLNGGDVEAGDGGRHVLSAKPIQNSTDIDDDYDVDMPDNDGPNADKPHNEEPTAAPPTHSSPLVHSAPTATEVPEVITISSDAPMKPELVSEGNTATTRPVKRSLEVEQPTPRSKALRKSDTALIRRVSALATPARSDTRRNSLLARSTVPKRFEPFSARSERGTPAATFIEPTGRRVLWARDVKGDDVGEEDDELA